jgi:hypothetical protein
MSDQKPDELFDAMAARIRLNPAEFQGAYLVVGPDGVVVSNSFFGPKPSVAMFWATAKNHVGIEADNAVQDAERKNQGAAVYGRR